MFPSSWARVVGCSLWRGLSSSLFLVFWDPLKPARVGQGGERDVHLFRLTRNFCFPSGLTSRAWRTAWKARWTSPSRGAALSRTCTEAAICPRPSATAPRAPADTPPCGEGFRQAAGDPRTGSEKRRGGFSD